MFIYYLLTSAAIRCRSTRKPNNNKINSPFFSLICWWVFFVLIQLLQLWPCIRHASYTYIAILGVLIWNGYDCNPQDQHRHESVFKSNNNTEKNVTSHVCIFVGKRPNVCSTWLLLLSLFPLHSLGVRGWLWDLHTNRYCMQISFMVDFIFVIQP